MDSEVTEFVRIAIAIILASVLIATGIQLLTATRAVAESINGNIETRDMLKEYREYNEYDDTVITGARVISFILEHEGKNIAIEVRHLGGVSQDYNGTVDATGLFIPEIYNPPTYAASKYYPGNLQVAIAANKSYKSTLYMGPNDEYSRIVFTEIDVGP